MLRSLPGMDFVYYGQGGIPSGPSVRGYTDRNFGQDMSGHFDGIPSECLRFRRLARGPRPDFVVPETLDRIELIRGPLDARYGDFNRGASVNYVTKDAVVRPSRALDVGTFGSWRAAGTFGSAPIRRAGSVLLLHDRRSPNRRVCRLAGSGTLQIVPQTQNSVRDQRPLVHSFDVLVRMGSTELYRFGPARERDNRR